MVDPMFLINKSRIDVSKETKLAASSDELGNVLFFVCIFHLRYIFFRLFVLSFFSSFFIILRLRWELGTVFFFCFFLSISH